MTVFMLQKGKCIGPGLDFKNYNSFDKSVKKDKSNLVKRLNKIIKHVIIQLKN